MPNPPVLGWTWAIYMSNLNFIFIYSVLFEFLLLLYCPFWFSMDFMSHMLNEMSHSFTCMSIHCSILLYVSWTHTMFLQILCYAVIQCFYVPVCYNSLQPFVLSVEYTIKWVIPHPSEVSTCDWKGGVFSKGQEEVLNPAF